MQTRELTAVLERADREQRPLIDSRANGQSYLAISFAPKTTPGLVAVVAERPARAPSPRSSPAICQRVPVPLSEIPFILQGRFNAFIVGFTIAIVNVLASSLSAAAASRRAFAQPGAFWGTDRPE